MAATPAPPSPPTVQESRLVSAVLPDGSPVARRVLGGTAEGALVDGLAARLEAAADLAGLAAVAREHGRRLWEVAVARAQDPDGAVDDRPLYWARTATTAALRALVHDAVTLAGHRRALVDLVDRASRGMTGDPWAGAPAGAVRVAVSGFDPFSLDDEPRRANPSGAAALALAGRVLDTAAGPVAVRAVVLPVLWGAFDGGVVEDAFGPVLLPGPDRADAVVTVSQTLRGRMDVEAWAAGWRDGRPDNDRAQVGGPVSRAARWPQPADPPQWIATTLPWEAMRDAGTGPWPVALNDGVLERPQGAADDPAALRARAHPSPGSTAAAGSGGAYLSNESMYRCNRLRQALGAHDVPGGHLHVSALSLPAGADDLDDDASRADRRAVVDQTVELVRATGGHIGHSRARFTNLR